jgi:hypothetical protein
MRPSPSTVLATSALFFALGGSALAISDAVKPQPRCAAGAVRGYISVDGGPNGVANIGDQFTSAKPAIGARFNCAGAAPQARRVNQGVYEVRFPGNGTQIGTASSSVETTIIFVGGGTFRVNLWVPGRQDAIDTAFQVVAV